MDLWNFYTFKEILLKNENCNVAVRYEYLQKSSYIYRNTRQIPIAVKAGCLFLNIDASEHSSIPARHLLTDNETYCESAI